MAEDIYAFNPREAARHISQDWKVWAERANAKKFIIGISGGKDSTVCAWLAAKIFGRKSVYGVLMPNGEKQALNADTALSRSICKVLGINCVTVDINDAFNCISNQAFLQCHGDEVIDNMEFDEPEYSLARINLPARLRMSTLFCVAQQFTNAVVICTDNLSESVLGYSTFGGDGFGCYAPLKDLTVTEVRQVAAEIGVPEFLYAKAPSDGLQDKTDEERFGFTYEDVDKCIRKCSIDEPIETTKLRDRIYNDYYLKNKFKLEIVNVPGPTFNFPNFMKNR